MVDPNQARAPLECAPAVAPACAGIRGITYSVTSSAVASGLGRTVSPERGFEVDRQRKLLCLYAELMRLTYEA
jgi:hypothetical protein